MSKSAQGFLAWMGVWIAGMCLGEMALQITSFSWICVYGIVVYWCCEAVRRWIES